MFVERDVSIRPLHSERHIGCRSYRSETVFLARFYKHVAPIGAKKDVVGANYWTDFAQPVLGEAPPNCHFLQLSVESADR